MHWKYIENDEFLHFLLQLVVLSTIYAYFKHALCYSSSRNLCHFFQISSKCPPNVLRICSECPPDFLQISSRFPPNVLQMFTRFPSNVLQISSRFPPNVLQMFTRFPPNVLQMSSRFHPNVLQISSCDFLISVFHIISKRKNWNGLKTFFNL